MLFSSLFDMTVWVAGSTHIVLFAKNVILGKDCEKNNSPIESELSFLTGTFFDLL